MKAANKIDYLPFLDGLRAIAVSVVIVFHYWASGRIMKGGFIGVDIFFVISGFLITSLLLKEWNQTERIDLKQFWLRRARRLFPALAFMLLTLIITAFLCPAIKEKLIVAGWNECAAYLPYLDGELAVIKHQILAAVFYSINWYFIFHGGSYFELTNRPSLLTHLWSLAIEEQFYLLWPILAIIILRNLRKKRAWLVVAVSISILLSAALMLIEGKTAPLDARAYYGTDCRAYALLLGALIAILRDFWRWPQASTLPSKVLFDLLGFSGLIILAWLSWNLDGQTLFVFHGGLFLAAASTALIIIAGISESRILNWILSLKPLHWIGKRSYGLYIWHWPIFILTDPAYTYPLSGWPLLALRLSLLLGTVEFSYKYVETPIREGVIEKMILRLKETRKRSDVWKLVGAGLVASTTIIFCFVAIVTAQPDAGPFSENIPPARTEAKMPPVSVSTGAQVPIDKVSLVSVVSAVSVTECNLPEQSARKIEDKKIDSGKITSSEKSNRNGPYAIGDSVMLGAKPALQDLIPGIIVNAKVSRQFSTMLQIILRLKARHELPEEVIIHGGTNGTIEEKPFREMMDALSTCRRVVILNLCVPRTWGKPNNRLIDRIVPEYKNAVLVNWHQACQTHRQLIYKDGIHLRNRQGAMLYAKLIQKALEK